MEIIDSLERNKDITEFSGYKTYAQAEYYFEVKAYDDIQKLHRIYAYAKKNSLPFLILGGGMNCLFAFDTFHGIIVKNFLSHWEFTPEKKLVADSNSSIWNIAETLEEENGVSIWHRFIGLPGSIGGAVYGNAGCFGLEAESNFLSAQVLDLETGEIRTFIKSEMNFSYRSSILKEIQKYFLISASFDLSRKEEKYHSDADVRLFRETKQPKGNTCGSFFKNPSKEQTAGMLIEQVGMKGMRRGGAYFSDLHANFLMSDGVSCSWKDLIILIKKAEIEVKMSTGIELEREVQVILPHLYVPV